MVDDARSRRLDAPRRLRAVETAAGETAAGQTAAGETAAGQTAAGQTAAAAAAPADTSAAATDASGELLGSVELLADSVRAALVAPNGTVVRRTEQRLDPRHREAGEFERVVVDTAKRCFFGMRLRGVGVASAGLVDHTSGVIRQLDEVPALQGFPIAQILERALRVPIFADHRARLQALGDRWFGHGLGRTSFASVATGTTLGVGILFEGHLIAPLGGRSGAHITVDGGGEPCTCGNRGCWKTIATTRWLQDAAAAIGLGRVEGIHDVVAAARVDDAARELVDRYADNLALGLSVVQHLLAPGLYIVHGDAVGGGDAFLGRIEASLRSVSAWADFAELPRVVAADTAADDVALLGGAGLVLSRLGSA